MLTLRRFWQRFRLSYNLPPWNKIEQMLHISCLCKKCEAKLHNKIVWRPFHIKLLAGFIVKVAFCCLLFLFGRSIDQNSFWGKKKMKTNRYFQSNLYTAIGNFMIFYQISLKLAFLDISKIYFKSDIFFSM